MAQNLELQLVINADGTATVRTLREIDDSLDSLNDTSAQTERGVGSTFKSLASKVAMFGSALAGVATVGFGAMVKSNLEAVGELRTFTTVANTNAQEFQKLANGASVYGIESDKLADILKDMNDRVGDFKATGGGAMKDFFDNIAPKVGITAEQFKNLSGADALQLYYNGLEKANLSQADMTFYLEAVASDATNLIPLLENGGEGFKKFGELAEKSGAILSDVDIKNAEKMNQDLKVMGLQWQGFKNSVVQSVMPILKSISDYYQANKELINSNLNGFINNAKVAFDYLKTAVSGAIDVLKTVGQWATRNKEVLIPLASAVTAMVGAFVAMKAVTGVITAVRGAMLGLNVAMLGLRAGMAVFSAMSFIASPIGIAVVAIGALVAIGVALYRNWDTIKAKANQVWGGIKTSVSNALNGAKAKFDEFKRKASLVFIALKTIAKIKLHQFKATVKNAFNAMPSPIKRAFNIIKAVVKTGITVIKTIFKTGFNLVKNTVKTVFNAIKALARGDFKGFVNIIKGGLRNAVNIAKSGVSKIWTAFKTLGTKLFSIGKDAVQGLINGVKGKISGAIEVAKNLASSVSNTVKNFFVIRSPSRLMAKYGGNISEGLAVGIKKKGNKPVKAMTEVAKKIQQANKSVTDEIASINKRLVLKGDTSKLASFDYDVKNSTKYNYVTKANLSLLRQRIKAEQDFNKQLATRKANEQIAQKISDFKSSNADKLAQYQFETSLIGKQAEEVERLKFKHQLMQQVKSMSKGFSDKNKQALQTETNQIIAQRDELIALRKQQQELKNKDWIGGIKEGLASIANSAKSLNETMKNATTSAFNKMSDGIATFVATGKGNFKDLARSIIQDISKMLVKFAMLRLAKMALGAFGGGGLFANGGAFNSQGVQYYAKGDIFNKPTAFRHAGGLGIMGEAGAEAIMPLTRGSDGKLGVKVYGNKQTNANNQAINQVQIDITINNDGANADVQTSTQDGKRLADNLKAVVLQVLEGEIRQGGMLDRG